MTIGYAIAQQRLKALDMSNVCKNPAISAAARQTTKDTDVTNRWLAAQEVFTSIQNAKMWTFYQQATNSMSVIINGVKYPAFIVTYSDGYSEKWAVSPNWAFSAVKLFDQPMPGSLAPPSGSSSSCAQA